MDKPTEKKKIYNQEILKVLKTRHGYTIDYIQKSIRGDRTGIIPDRIKKEYETLEREANKIINSKADTL